MTPSLFPNRALAALREGQALSCLWLSLGSAALAEIAAEQAPDAVVLDLQHGLWESGSLHAAVAAIAVGSTALVRVAENRPFAIGQALDAGAAGVIVPLIDTAGDAERAVAACHYPPDGIRSGGALRPLRDFPAYAAASRAHVLVAPMIETAAGLDNVAAIARTPGIAMLFIGPGDLGLALGGDAAALEAAIGRILAVCRDAGLPCGIFTGSPAMAARRVAEGFRFVVAADDIQFVRGGFADALRMARQDFPPR
jgi:2-dehydro-3-deoxyglucarate aldolase/4-hydroxy-2-oxoheptanedioate aldolase